MLAHLQVVLELELSQPRGAAQEGHGMDANACAAVGLEAPGAPEVRWSPCLLCDPIESNLIQSYLIQFRLILSYLSRSGGCNRGYETTCQL